MLGFGSIQKTNAQDIVVTNNNYEILGTRKGEVIVKDRHSKKILHEFQMDNLVIRELFILNGGNVLAAAQKDNTTFWDLKTEKIISKFNQRIYGFSHDQETFLTYKSGKIILYNYHNMNKLCESLNSFNEGPEEFKFSPDDKFLAIVFATGRPANDQYYPQTGPLRRSIRYSKLFTTNNCEEIQEFSKLRVVEIGTFSQNSDLYFLKNTTVLLDNKYLKSSWQFNLYDHKLEQNNN
jgi:hypothetical protein